MTNNFFQFKQFVVYQNKSAMKVGTDSVLLGSWANFKNAKHILDIGTGTGILALMAAQKSNAIIDAVEIDYDSYLEALENINNSNWRNRVFVHNISFQEFVKKSKRKYNIIICNPPYFINSLKSPDSNRNIARHNNFLQLSDLITGVSTLLSYSGFFYIILPYETGCSFISEALKNKLFCKKKVYIKPKNTSKIKRLLLEFHKKESIIDEKILVIEKEERHHYTDEFKELTKDFYLSFKY